MASQRQSDPIRFFLPGPTYVRRDVLEAMTRPLAGHRSAAFKELYTGITPRLQQVMRTAGDVMVTTGSATLVMESAILSTVRNRVLNLTCGAFSERWHAISVAVGKEAEAVSVPWGEGFDPDLVCKALRGGRYDAVTIVHNETSTGVINPLEEIARVIREESDSLILVDTVSSLGGAQVETDAWGLDVVLAGGQKALAVPPGITVFSMSERAGERAELVANRGFYTDFLRSRDQHRKGGTATTPAMSIFFALDRQLDVMLAEGMEERWSRHLALQDTTSDWAESRGIDYASATGVRSPTVSCFRPPAGTTAPELVAALAERGFVVGGGYGKWKPETFRIGHMGEVRESDLQGLFAVIEEIVN